MAAAVSGEPGIVLQSLAVSGVPRSGKPAELLDLFGINAKNIIAAVKSTFAN